MKKNQHILLLGILFLLLLCSVGGYVYAFSRISKKTSSIESIVTEIENEKKSQQNILGLKRSIVLSEEKNSVLNSYFVNEETVVDFIKSIELLAKESNVSVQISSLQSGEQTGKQGLYVSLVIKGSFNSVNSFLLLLENMPYQIIINKVMLATENSTLTPSVDPKTGKTQASSVGQWGASIDFILVSYRKE